jgi:Transposase DDE domain
MKFTEELPDLDKITSKLTKYFDRERIEALAKSTNFIKKPRKLTGFAFFSLCILQSFGCSLTVMCGQLHEMSIFICQQSLNERFTKHSVVFMKRLFDQMLKLEISSTVPIDVLSLFRGIFIQDATGIKLPDSMVKKFKGTGGSSGKSSLKVDFRMDIQSASYDINIRPGASSENNQAVNKPQAGALYIRDLGYFNFQLFRDIMDKCAYFLSRLKVKSVLYADNKGKITLDICQLSKGLKVNETLHMAVYVGSRIYLPVFLILQKLPQDAVNTKIAKAKKVGHKSMTKVSKETLDWCEFNCYITNIPKDWISALTIIQIYTIRWQIEIIFKVWKSIYKMSELGQMNTNRGLCMLYGRLTWILMQMKVFVAYKKNIYGVTKKELSELSGYMLMNEHKEKFKNAVLGGLKEAWRLLLNLLMEILMKFAIKKKRPKDMPPLYNADFKAVT